MLQAKKRLAGLRPGSRLWLETTDPLAVIDIPAFCSDEGHRLVEREATGDGHRFLVERGPAKKSDSPEFFCNWWNLSRAASGWPDDGLSPPPIGRHFLLQAGRKAGFSFWAGPAGRLAFLF